MAEVDWKALQIVANVSTSVGAVMKPAGFENGQGVLSAHYAKDAGDAQWKDCLLYTSPSRPLIPTSSR